VLRTIAQRTLADIDKARLLAQLAKRPRLSEEEAEAQAVEDGDAWTKELAEAEPVYPPPSAAQVRALGKDWDWVRRSSPVGSGSPSKRPGNTTIRAGAPAIVRDGGALLRVIEADPEALARALALRKAG
jgi:hypothetical protein